MGCFQRTRLNGFQVTSQLAGFPNMPHSSYNNKHVLCSTNFESFSVGIVLENNRTDRISPVLISGKVDSVGQLSWIGAALEVSKNAMLWRAAFNLSIFFHCRNPGMCSISKFVIKRRSEYHDWRPSLTASHLLLKVWRNLSVGPDVNLPTHLMNKSVYV